MYYIKRNLVQDDDPLALSQNAIYGCIDIQNAYKSYSRSNSIPRTRRGGLRAQLCAVLLAIATKWNRLEIKFRNRLRQSKDLRCKP